MALDPRARERIDEAANRLRRALTEIETVDRRDFDAVFQTGVEAGYRLADLRSVRALQGRATRRAIELEADGGDVTPRISVKFSREELMSVEERAAEMLAQLNTALRMGESDPSPDRWTVAHVRKRLGEHHQVFGPADDAAAWFDAAAETYDGIAPVEATRLRAEAEVERYKAEVVCDLRVARVRDDLGALPPLPRTGSVRTLEFGRDA